MSFSRAITNQITWISRCQIFREIFARYEWCCQMDGNIFEIADKHDDVIKWKHLTFSALLAANWPFVWGKTPVTGGFPSQRPVTRSFDAFFYLRLDKRLSKQPRRRWFETPSRSLWRNCNASHCRHRGTHCVGRGMGTLFTVLVYLFVSSLSHFWLINIFRLHLLYQPYLVV